MVTCINDGTNYNVTIPLRLMLIVLFLLFMSSLFTIIMYNTQKNKRNELCRDFGILNYETNSQIVLLFAVLLTISSFITIGLVLKSISNAKETLFNRIFKPFVGLMCSIGFLTGLIIYSQEKNTTQGNKQDPNIITWCMNENNDIKGVIYPTAIFFVLVILSIISVLSLSIHRKCAL